MNSIHIDSLPPEQKVGGSNHFGRTATVRAFREQYRAEDGYRKVLPSVLPLLENAA
jgi:hypothetical protein